MRWFAPHDPRSGPQRAAYAAREVACDLYARKLFNDVIKPIQHLTNAEVAQHLNAIRAPRLRGANVWTHDDVAAIRARLARRNISASALHLGVG